MARIERPPEYADGGFWYVVPVEIVTDGGGAPTVTYPAGFARTDYCAWYSGSAAVVRTPDLVAGVPTIAASAASILAGYPGKPFARIRGR